MPFVPIVYLVSLFCQYVSSPRFAKRFEVL